jgi:hypothetical protein
MPFDIYHEFCFSFFGANAIFVRVSCTWHLTRDISVIYFDFLSKTID